eukprot:JP446607.1.p2 GENE.JP446607.1~~JP446607.1.p2  ORF type:complete len:166 (-),score=73.59 JP446607.1:285-782(-)
MEGDWNKLGKSFAGNDNVQIVDVDCTADGQQTCGKVGVKGYPTVKYYTSSTGKKGADYQQGRDFASLKAFADRTLDKGCNPSTGAGCKENEKAFIAKVKAFTPDEHSAEMQTKQDALKALKKEKSDAEAEWKDKEKAFKKKEKLLTMAVSILKKVKPEGAGKADL